MVRESTSPIIPLKTHPCNFLLMAGPAVDPWADPVKLQESGISNNQSTLFALDAKDAVGSSTTSFRSLRRSVSFSYSKYFNDCGKQVECQGKKPSKSQTEKNECAPRFPLTKKLIVLNGIIRGRDIENPLTYRRFLLQNPLL